MALLAGGAAGEATALESLLGGAMEIDDCLGGANGLIAAGAFDEIATGAGGGGTIAAGFTPKKVSSGTPVSFT